jgi:hypothetical protein
MNAAMRGWWCAGVLTLLGCSSQSPVSTPGPQGVPTTEGDCRSSASCPTGQECIGDICQPRALPDGGAVCERDEDCAPGLQCVRSSGQCIVPQSNITVGTPDAGDPNACNLGQTEPCGVSKLGECRLGTRTCSLDATGAYRFADCKGFVNPVAESCNGKDDDCDGDVDDGFGVSTCGVGECRFVTDACIAGIPQACAPRPSSPETCDGKDNDCDGTVDEGLGSFSCGVGACARTVTACVAGQPQACTPGQSQSEVCNGLDDDCDGQTDEGLAPLNCGVGACARTIAACLGGQPQTCTPGTPTAEVCNGQDDDCDGTADDSLGTVSCGTGTCARTVAACVGGVTQTCTPGTPSSELCDGKDNDCDGQTDDGLGTVQCGTGACARSVAACLGGQTQTCTPGAPTAEVCDGTDNDCDGNTDEALADVTCGQGICQRTVVACTGGQTQTCTPGPSSAEACNGVDDDCDGTVDEGCNCLDGQTRACYTGPAGTVGVGACHGGSQTCVSGNWAACGGQVLPSTEVCNGVDDDCDGSTNEGLGTIACGTGVCARTVQACVSGQPQTCSPGAPSTEVCDGADNDCDGSTDEGLGTVSCGVGACVRTIQACVGGQSQSCAPGAPTAEVCNALDDDCDGTPDDGLGTLSCGTGVCARTVAACVGGQSQTCTPGSGTVESCNNRDDDCDGTVDEGLGTRSCGTGACARTVNACVGGVSQTCNPGLPFSETCNGVDDDCDGTADEGLGNLTCGAGVCARSVPACIGGSPQTCTPGQPSSETCNSLDDDCDGSVDETFPQQTSTCSTALAGVCGTGQYACTSGALTCRQTVFPTTDVCSDGKDQDCNGRVDDGPGCCTNTADNDVDGVSFCNDCNDNDGSIHPGATEICDGKDNDCDGVIDEGFDGDADGFTRCGTVPGGGLSPSRVDCNDNNPFVFPLKATDCGVTATPNSPNGVDDNCNGYVDETCGCSTVDADGDGRSECQGDCNDSDPTVAPGRAEICDGKDNDCNRATTQSCGVSDRCGFKQGNSWTPWTAGTDECKPDLLCVSSLATGELTCGSFCNQTSGIGLGDSCQANEGCLRNLIDSDNQHLCGVTTTGGGTTGSACSLSTQCRSGDCLTTDGPTDYCTDKCTHEAGCSSNTTCYVQESSLTSGPFVIGTYLWSSCRLDTNIAGTRTTGQSCSTSSTCRAGPTACLNGVCIEPCCMNSDCGAGRSCSILGPRRATGYQNAASESIVSVVPSCVGSSAVKVSGQACAASSECRSGICDNDRRICVDLCCNDGSCVNGTTCEPVDVRFTSGETTLIRACVFAPVPVRIQQR